MGVLATLVNFVPTPGVPAATASPLVSQVPVPLNIVRDLLGCFVAADNTVAAAPGVTRTTQVALVPTAAASGTLTLNQDGQVIGVALAVNGLGYTLPPFCEAVHTPGIVGGGGIGALLKSFLNVSTVTVNGGGGGFDPPTTEINFIGGLPPANYLQPFRGCVRQLTVVESGAGYDPLTRLQVLNGGRPTRQARAIPTWSPSGQLLAVTLIDMGAGYTAIPQIGFLPPAGSITQPTVPAKVGVAMAEGDPATATLTIVAGAITAVNMVNLGSGYVGVPTPFIYAPVSGSGFVGTVNMRVERVDVIAPGTGYVNAPGNLLITPVFQEYFPGGALASPEQAKPFVRLQTPAIAQNSLSPVVATPPVIT